VADELFRRERLQPSLLDRLTDDAPEQKRESLERQTLTMIQLRQAVLRDLAWLLNTTNLDAIDDLTAYPRVAETTLNFGIPGFTGVVAATQKVADLEASIADAIRRFEPRIRPNTLRVHARKGSGEFEHRSLVFEIRGELWAQPVPQQLFLETQVDIETRLAVVSDLPGTRAAGRG
jgi:type VI secretion system protein ImpF